MNTKEIEYNTKSIRMIMQNENGPCPIIAIANCLLLNGNMQLAQSTDNVSFGELVEMIGNYLLTVERSAEEGDLTQNLSDTLELLPKLEHGLDINIHFMKSDSFEFTAAVSLFDICSLNLFHGWVISPSDIQNYELIARRLKSYNALVDTIVRGDAVGTQQSPDVSVNDELLSHAAVCKDFLEEYPTQLTQAGIDSIKELLPEDRPAVLFRNNHFYTLIKRGGLLYTMVTDQGYTKSPIVWESLDSISGSSTHYDCNFQLLDPELPTYRQSLSEIDRVKHNLYADPLVADAGPTSSSSHGNQELDPDLLLALELQDEEDRRHRDEMRRLNANSHLVGDGSSPSLGGPSTAPPPRNQNQQRPNQQMFSTNSSSSSLNRRKGKDDCVILNSLQATSCSKQSDCLSVGSNSNCVFTSAATANATAQGTCSTPVTSTLSSNILTPTSSASTPTSTVTTASNCGNSTISNQCAFGQVCVNQECTNLDSAAKSFFTPTMIAIFVIAGLVILCAPVLICFLCKCCCFSGRVAGRAAKKVVAAPFRQPPSNSDHNATRQTQPQRSSQYGAPNPQKYSAPTPQTAQYPYGNTHGSIVSVQKNGGPAPVPSNFPPAPAAFHIEERVEYLPMIPTAAESTVVKSADEPFEFVPYDQFMQADTTDPLFRNPYVQGALPPQPQQQSPMPVSANTMDFHTPVMNQRVGPVIREGVQPPPFEGFFGFWDQKGQFHQGYSDRELNVQAGVFDDLSYFHFGTVGQDEPVLVEDHMMAGYTSNPNGPDIQISSFPEDIDSDSARYTLTATQNNDWTSQIDSMSRPLPHQLSIPQDPTRERGESMDVNSPSLVKS